MLPVSHASEIITARLQVMKDLYAELFVLLDRSVEEDPMTEQVGGLDMIIERLMQRAGAELPGFLGEVNRARAAGALDAATDAALAEFTGQLKIVLKIMSDRVQRRAQALAAQREDLKGRMLTVKRKSQSAKGYRTYKDQKILESHI